MLSSQEQVTLKTLYTSYLDIKPLIADVEQRLEGLPEEVWNAIRNFTDHIARVYYSADDGLPLCEELRVAQLRDAQAHLTRLQLDCYKYLNVFEHDAIRAHYRETRNLQLGMIDDGAFSSQFSKLEADVKNKAKKARTEESRNQALGKPDQNMRNYQEANIAYRNLNELIEDNGRKIGRVKRKYLLGRVAHFAGAFGLLLFGAAAGAVAQILLEDQPVMQTLKQLLAFT
jgi:hypothetical protein